MGVAYATIVLRMGWMRFKEDPEVHEMFGDFTAEARYLGATRVPKGEASSSHGHTQAPAPIPAPPREQVHVLGQDSGAAGVLTPIAEVAGETRVFAESALGFKKGDAVPSLLGAVAIEDRVVVSVRGGILLARRAAESAVDELRHEDLRPLPVMFDVQSERRREFAKAVAVVSL